MPLEPVGQRTADRRWTVNINTEYELEKTMYLSRSVTTAALLLATASTVQAQTRSWTGGPNETDFGDVDNWTITLPNEDTIAIIGGSVPAENSNVILDKDRTLGGLVLTDGMDLNTNTNHLTIDDLNGTGVIVSGQNVLPNNSLRPTTLTVEYGFGYSALHVIGGSTQIKNGGRLVFKGGSNLLADGGEVVVDPTSVISGHGRITTILPGQTSINNNGTIWANSAGGLLHLNGIAVNLGGFAGGKYDLDGSNESGTLRVSSDSEMVIVAELSDSFDGNIHVDKGGQILISPLGEATSFVLGTSSDANVTLNGTADKPARFFVAKDTFVGTHTNFMIDGHGRIQGSADNVRNFFATGDSLIDIADGGSLVFEHKATTINSGKWVVGDEAVLDFQDTLISAKSTEVVLDGGLITSDGPGLFHNNNLSGIRGHGRFELPMSNDTFISADGGELVIDGWGGVHVDWDGVNNNGQLYALNGDLKLIDNNPDNAPAFNGEIRVGNGKTLMFDNFGFDFGPESRVQLTGGLVDQSIATLVHVHGQIEVFEASTWDLFSYFEDSADVKLGDDLRIASSVVFHEGASFTGDGDLIIDSLVRFHDGVSFDVDVVNQFQMHIDPGNPGAVSINGDMDNLDRIVFRLYGDTPDLYDQLLISENLAVRSGIFDVNLSGGFIPDAGDEFDILDFASFIDEGYELQLPDLTDGLIWDTSDFTTLGTIRIAAVPEPASIALMTIGGAMMCRRRVA